MSEIVEPVFVVGVDHSGTTILYRMLARHPDLAWFSQYSLRAGEIPGRRRVPVASTVERAGRRLLAVPWEKWDGRLPPIRPVPREGTGIWRRLVPRTKDFQDERAATPERVAAVRAAVGAHLSASRRERMLVKIPYLSRAVLLLDAVFPDARFVHIHRDGRAVALSNRQLFAEGLSEEQALREAAQDWVDTMTHLRTSSELLGDRCIEVRYEDFCADVHGALRDILDFCHLDPARFDAASLPGDLEVTNGRWIDGCTTEDAALLDQVLGGTLEAWGYPRSSPQT